MTSDVSLVCGVFNPWTDRYTATKARKASYMAQGNEQFIVRFWGVRGSIPTPGPDTVRYGGNTTCIEVRCDDQVIVIDTGTGARRLGTHLLAQSYGEMDLRLFYSHLHMDHIQGFPFFAPI